MANYYAAARSNYFKVKDEGAFQAWAESRQLGVWSQKDGEGDSELYAIYSDAGDDDGWPLNVFNEKTDELEHICVEDELAEHLADGSVAVLMEAGAEKLRYIKGYAVAVNNKGESARIDLRDIYLAADRLGDDVSTVED